VKNLCGFKREILAALRMTNNRVLITLWYEITSLVGNPKSGAGLEIVVKTGKRMLS
jgi:hypothetical protein